MSTYFVMDGRADYDLEAATVLDVFDASDDKEAKTKIDVRGWLGIDVVLANKKMQIIY